MNSSNKQSASLLIHFESLEDPRTEYLIEHRLLDIVGRTICAVICGADSWVEIEEYGNSNIGMAQRVFRIILCLIMYLRSQFPVVIVINHY
ncbi:hypothetical protein H1P_10004 [Hyella patelloides LEGE 07179]|uniref:H repeat-associated protein N-terminal domain-containing protein n=1 Tax=Hyella patelloides LEGE 07179 TaxID=945734 RepID=A0A563VIK3_9CYAN|nr:transposase family protein [Hyella patelloides]VEP11219.1 hypothetical protein H1P_10004 [Hyella patelloides LEGE 07179]